MKRSMRRGLAGLVWTGAAMLAVGCCTSKPVAKQEAPKAAENKPAAPAAAQPAAQPAAAAPAKQGEWEILFDGKTLGKWKPTEFGGQAEVKIKDGAIILPIGNDMTGVTYTGPVPKVNYEISLDAMRVDGGDFFCGLTFPVVNSHASLVLGGWGGTVCGISSIDGYDAADNMTTGAKVFKEKQWYHVRMRVQADRLMAWVDDDNIVDVSTVDKKLSVRSEMEESRPLGIATWRTTGAAKNIKIRMLKPEEIVPKKDDF